MKRPGLVEAIAAAEAREQAEAKAKQEAEARAAVDAVIGRLAKEYEAPAAVIAKFLADWKHAAALAVEACVPSPERLVRYREPQLIEPADEEAYFFYIDESVHDTVHSYSPGTYDLSPDSTPIIPKKLQRREERRTRSRPAKYDQGAWLHPLAAFANLPPARIEKPAIWEGDDVVHRSTLPTEHVRRAF